MSAPPGPAPGEERRPTGDGHRRRASRRPCQDADLPEHVVPLSLPTPYPVGPVTVYLLLGEPLTLVDSGPATREAWHRLVHALAARGIHPGAIRRVLLTHAHHDHFGLAGRLASFGAEVAAHPHEADSLAMRRYYRVRWRHLRAAGLPRRACLAVLLALRALDRTARAVGNFRPIVDGARLEHSGGALRVHHLPGHAPGHVGFELEGTGLMLSGDVLLSGITPNAIVEIDPVDPNRLFGSVHAYQSSLARLLRLDLVRLLPSHGPCLRDIEGEVARVLEQQGRRAEQVRALLREIGPVTVEALRRRLFPGVSPMNAFLAYSEVQGHVTELERRHEVERQPGAGGDLWRLREP